ncbi:secreted RxLR effector protein 78-like [Lotus japonicus]|uniref:secreted RxLR effector protein 78-like n=1 Tax=Lotus japonicus TaxID=34305 RepID=UPI00258584EA|nr:secreted RxLR effector protein 78-like [Lotus japonicus]
MFKVISKVLANRIKGVLSDLIDECQFYFVGERNMQVSVLVANEAIHEAKRRKMSTFVLKVDYEKDYESVEWSFLFYMLKRMNFGENWVRWIRGCLESSTISVLVNGSPSEEFKLEKGLRQGDPLAPFLFIIIS